MLITEILSRNARMNGRETAFIEREPEKITGGDHLKNL